MPMTHEGILFMSKAAPVAGYTRQGEFKLTMTLLDKEATQSGHHYSRYLVTWVGEAARQFWQERGPQLNAGTVLRVRLKQLGTHYVHRDIEPDLTAWVDSVELIPKTHMGGADAQQGQ